MIQSQKNERLSGTQVLLSFWPFFKPYKKQILRWFSIYGAYFVLGIGTPLAVEFYIDHILKAAISSELRLWIFVLAYGLYALGYHFFYLVGQRGTVLVIEMVVADLRFTVYEKLHRLSIRFFDKNVSGEIVNHVLNDTRQLLNLVGGELVQVTLQIGAGIICVVILIYWNIRLCAVVLAFLPAYGLLFFRYLPRVRRAAKRWRHAEDAMWGNWGEKLRGMDVIQAFAREKREELRHHEFGHPSSAHPEKPRRRRPPAPPQAREENEALDIPGTVLPHAGDDAGALCHHRLCRHVHRPSAE